MRLAQHLCYFTNGRYFSTINHDCNVWWSQDETVNTLYFKSYLRIMNSKTDDSTSPIATFHIKIKFKWWNREFSASKSSTNLRDAKEMTIVQVIGWWKSFKLIKSVKGTSAVEPSSSKQNSQLPYTSWRVLQLELFEQEILAETSNWRRRRYKVTWNCINKRQLTINTILTDGNVCMIWNSNFR